MKPLFTIALLFAYLISFGQQGVELKVKILPDNQTYQVLLRATADDPTGNNMITAGAQITLRVPTGGFQTGTVTNLAGTWSNSPPLIAPAENPGFDYFFFTLDALTTAVTIQQGLEVPLFNFTNAGSCTGAMELYDNDTDPIQFPNSLNVNLANTITVVGFGLGNSYLGNYNAISADCGHTYECEDQPGEFIDVTDLVFTRPDCGVANGSIFIEATGSLEPGFPLQYSINGFNNANWQNDPLFTGLQSGDIYEIYLRFAGGFCRFHLGDYELLPPPVGTLQSADLQMPDCGMSNGSITMTAFPSNGAILQYGYSIPSVMPVPVYQDSPILADLAAGTYILWLRDRDNPDCETNVGNYILDEDCTAVPCSNFDLQSLGNGRYSVSLTPGETLNAPNNVTESLSVTIKVPTGGFNLGNLVSDVTNVSFAVANTVVAPAEAPGFDYITIELSSTNTSDIPYIAGNNTLLFSFENTGTCEGADISIVPTDDPYLLSGANIGLDVTVTGSMVNECIGTGTAACDAVPNMCPLTYQLDKLPNGDFQVSLLPSVTLPAGGMSTTSTLQVTIKTPTGGFIPDQITSLVTGVTIVDAGSATAPTEDPLHDYFSFSMSEAFTLSIPYTSGVIVPLFTFKNIGPCVSGDIFLMDNATDPFFVQPNSQGVNVGQIMTVLGIGASINVCLSSQASVECQGDPCLSLVAGFTAPDGCQGENITFTNTTTSNEANLSWEWNFGDGTPTSDLESPSHTFSNSGNFEVSLTVTTPSGCVATTTEFVAVFSLPDAPAVTEYTDCGSGVEITVPNADNIAWSPDTGLDFTNGQANPLAHPMTTTTYTVTLTNADGCQTATDITVTADVKPTWKDATASDITDCGLQDGQILVTATSNMGGDVEYSIDNINWTLDTLFTGLAAGDYAVFARNASGNCPIAYFDNPVTVTEPTAPSIDDVQIVQPTGFNSDGSITIVASGGDAPLQYTLVGVAGPQDSNVFSGLAEGNYDIEVTNATGSCLQTTTATLVGNGVIPTIVSAAADIDYCAGATTQVEITLSEDIQSINVTSGNIANEVINGPTVTFDVTPSMGQNDFAIELTGINGGTVTDNFTVTGVSGPTASFTNSATLCTGGDITLNFTGTATANATFDWSLDGAEIIFPAVPTDADQTRVVRWSDSGMKNVSLTVNDLGCSDNAANNLQIAAFDPNASFSSTDPSCEASDGTIDLSVTGNLDFTWSGPGISGAAVNQQNQAGLPGGNYSVTISDPLSSCEAVETVSLEIPTGLSISASATDATDCIGSASDGSITVNVSLGNAGFDYQLFAAADMGTPLAVNENSASNSNLFNNLEAGAYVVVVTDASGCSDQSTVAIQSVNGGVTAAIASQTNPDCLGINGSLTIDITAGEAPFTYDYFLNNTAQTIDADINGNSLSIAGVGAGSGVVIIRGADGCIAPISFAMTEQAPAFLDDISENKTQPSCDSNDGVIELTNLPASPFFSWSHDPTLSGPIASGLAPGVYTVTVFDGNGCSGERQITLNSTDGPELEITGHTDPTCGDNNGSLTFTVTAGNDFSYSVPGGSSGFGSVGDMIEVTGLGAGTWVVEVSDLINVGCNSIGFEVLEGEINQGSIIITNTINPPSECGVEDASIEIEINNNNLYSISTDKGSVSMPSFTSNVMVNGLYQGMVNVTLTDTETGCTTDLPFELDSVEMPEVKLTDLMIGDITCPGEVTSIEANNGKIYQIFDAAGDQIAATPWMGAAKGNYTIRLTDGQCMDEMPLEIEGPDDFEVAASIQGETCAGEDGSIALEVNGGTSPYSYEWNNGSDAENTNLSAGAYRVTITDANGCTFVEEDLRVDFACADQCDFIFSKDTIFVSLDRFGQTSICVPTPLTIEDFKDHRLVLDNTPYDSEDVTDCSSTEQTYSADLAGRTPPFRLEDWTINGERFGGLAFNSIEELVQLMNVYDPTGNWTLQSNQLFIKGGDSASDYGNLVITDASSATLNLSTSATTEVTPGILVNNDRLHILIAQDPLDASCSDTLYINLVHPDGPQVDTMSVQVPLDGTVEVCLDASELFGNLEFLDSECPSFSGNAQLILSGNECVELEGLSIGADEFCLVLCDDLGNCDTTVLEVTVGYGDEELEVYTGISPNGDGVNDKLKIRNIENYPNNDIVIFNRWGNRVYKKKSYDNDVDPWDAIHEGKVLPDGTYFYIMNVEIDGKMETRKGYISVRR